MKQLAVAAAVIMLLLQPTAAHAARTSVPGTNAYTKLVLANNQKAVVTKMFGPGGGPCSVKYVTAKFRDRDGTRYTIDGGCYGAGDWVTSLSRGQKLKSCAGFKLTYNESKGFWRGVVPRSCLKGLANSIKVTTSWIDDRSPTPGEAGPTKYVARG